MRNKTRKSYGKKKLENKISNNVNFENNLFPLLHTTIAEWELQVKLKSVNCNQRFIQPLNKGPHNSILDLVLKLKIKITNKKFLKKLK